MRAELEIPDTKYSRLTARAQQEGTSVDTVLLRIIDKALDSESPAPDPLNRRNHPVIPSTRKDKLIISNEQIYDLIGFP